MTTIHHRDGRNCHEIALVELMLPARRTIVFGPGDSYIEVDASKLPKGSVFADNTLGASALPLNQIRSKAL
jgi:hypothetical protein